MDKEWLKSLDEELRKDLEKESWEPPEGSVTINRLMSETGWGRSRAVVFLDKSVASGLLVRVKRPGSVVYVPAGMAPEWASDE